MNIEREASMYTSIDMHSTDMYVNSHIHIRIHVHVHAHVHARVHVHVHTHTYRQTDGQTGMYIIHDMLTRHASPRAIQNVAHCLDLLDDRYGKRAWV